MLANDGCTELTSSDLAVLLPVMIALVLVPIQVTVWWHARQVADAAAQEAVDAALVATVTASDEIEAAERFLDAAGNLTEPDVRATEPLKR